MKSRSIAAIVALVLLSQSLLFTNVGLAASGPSYISASKSTVFTGETIQITVYTADENGAIANVPLTLEATDGNFPITGTTTIEAVQTNSSGLYVADWIAPLLPFSVVDETVSFQARLSFANGTDATLNTTVTVVHPDANAIAHSTISMASSVASGETVTVKATALSDTDQPTEYVQVTFSASDGSFETEAQGITDASGEFTATWKAPSLAANETELNVTISALFETGSGATLTVDDTINVQPTTATSVTITTSPSSLTVTSFETVQFIIHATVGAADANGADLSLSTDVGNFTADPQSQTFSTTADATGHATVSWTAP